MRFIKHERYYFYFLFLIINGIEMILELVASRVMSPFFGTSNFVWTAVIGIILLAASIGNLIGGKLSEKREVGNVLSNLFFLASVFVFFIPLLSDSFLPMFSDLGLGVRVSSIIASTILFLVPSILIATITPFLMKAELSESKELGNESGKIHALIAIGSLIGTFAGGFLLIPALGTDRIILLLSAVLLILSIVSIPKSMKKKDVVTAIAVYSILILVLMGRFVPSPQGELELEDGVSIDTEYSRIIVQDMYLDGEPIRVYKSSGAYFSGMYLNSDELLFDYTKRYDDALKWSEVKNVLMIGGAAYSYPKYFASHYPNKKMTVVEIDPQAEKIAKKYFHLGEILEKYPNALNLITADGRVYLNENNEKYDAIFNDAFSGAVPVSTLATKEAVKRIYDSLTDDGIYMSNVLGSINGKNSWFTRSEVKTIASVFPYVYIYRADGTEDDSYSNYMVVGSKKPVEADSLPIQYHKKDFVLTDNYSPVEQMVGDTYFEQGDD